MQTSTRARTEVGVEAEADPQPETNDRLVVHVRAGSRVAAEHALGSPAGWSVTLGRLVALPLVVTLVGHAIVDVVPWARPSFLGVALASLGVYALARGLGTLAPRLLARVRRVPLLIVALATGGLGACIGGIAGSTVAKLSPWLAHPMDWVLGGASFGLAYAVLLFFPLLFERLGRLPRPALIGAQGVAWIVATMYAAWNVASLG